MDEYVIEEIRDALTGLYDDFNDYAQTMYNDEARRIAVELRCAIARILNALPETKKEG